MKMEVNSECPVCKQILNKGSKYYSFFSNGGKEAYLCSKECNKIFDRLMDIIDDVTRRGFSYIDTLNIDFYTYAIDSEVCEYIIELNQNMESHIDVANKVLDYLIGDLN